MELDQFLAAVETMSAGDLKAVALSVENDSVTDEVDWWRATIAIDRAIRQARCSRQAATAATRAVEAVQTSAAHCGRPLPDASVTRVARAAAEVARGLVVGTAAAPIVRLLLEPWSRVVAVA